jgi:hypothetical protein
MVPSLVPLLLALLLLVWPVSLVSWLHCKVLIPYSIDSGLDSIPGMTYITPFLHDSIIYSSLSSAHLGKEV